MKQRVLLISDSQAHSTMLEQALSGEDYELESTMAANANLCRLAAKSRLDILVVAITCADTQSMECIQQLLQRQPVPVVMFVKQGDEQSAAEATRAGISAYVVNGLSPERIKPILATALTRFRQTHALRQELDKVQGKLQERKLVERAKGLLMQQHRCSENEAYAAMRKLAMEQNRRLSDIAEGVINITSIMN